MAGTRDDSLDLLRQLNVVTTTTAIAGFYTHHSFATASGHPAFMCRHPATCLILNGDVFVGAAQIRRCNGLLVFGGATSGE